MWQCVIKDTRAAVAQEVDRIDRKVASSIPGPFWLSGENQGEVSLVDPAVGVQMC